MHCRFCQGGGIGFLLELIHPVIKRTCSTTAGPKFKIVSRFYRQGGYLGCRGFSGGTNRKRKGGGKKR